MRRRPAGCGAQIAGVQPPLGIDRLGRGGGVVEVPLHHRVAAHQHLAVVGDAHLDTVTGPSCGGGDVGERIPRARQRHGAGLGEAVSRRQGLERKLLVHPAYQFDRDVGRTRDTGPQAAQLGLVPDPQQRVVQRGRPGEHRDAFCGNEFDDTVDVEDRHRQHRRTADERRDQPGLVPERVEVRVDHQIPVTLAQVGQVAPLLVQPQILAVVHHHALRARWCRRCR